MVIDKLAIADMGTTKASKPLNNVAQRSEEHQNPPAVVTNVTETATKDRWDAQDSPLPAADTESVCTVSLKVLVLPLVYGPGYTGSKSGAPWRA